MSQIPTRQFGLLEYDPDTVVEFSAGLPGFEDQTRFVLVERPAVAPILFMQSLDLPDLCFLTAPLSALDAGYELAVTPEDERRLGLASHEEMLCLAILSAAENGPLTANLLAPVLINLRTRRAVQAVRTDSRYSHRQDLTALEGSCS
jgi:flagellar assembly factor FliW